MYWFTGREKSTRLSTQILMPMIPMRPYSAVVTPPSTPGGMVLNTAPTFGDRLSTMAVRPATQYTAVEYTRVAAMTPMFSPYVVVPDPPKVPASVVATPSAISARPVERLAVASVIAATPRTCPTFSATSTSTTGRNIAMTDHVCGVMKSARWNSGRPIHGAASTGAKSMSVSPVPSWISTVAT